MNASEALRLTRLVKALVPGTKIEQDTPTAWALVLDDVSLDDATTALRTVYRDQGDDHEFGQRRIEPDDLLREVKRIRAKRIADAPHPIPPRELDDDPAAAASWLRRAWKAIGDGQPVPDTRGQLVQRDMRSLTAGRRP